MLSQVLDQDCTDGIATKMWSTVSDGMRSAISNKILVRCKSSKGTQLQFFLIAFKKVFCGPACDRVLLAFIGGQNKDKTLLPKSRIDQGHCVWDEKEKNWIRSSIWPSFVCVCAAHAHNTCLAMAVAWRNYVGDEVLQTLPEPETAEGDFKLSPLWVYAFTHVSMCRTLYHICAAHCST